MGSVLALAITGCSAKVTPPSGAAEPTGSSVSDTADTSSEEPSAEEEEQEISLQSETAQYLFPNHLRPCLHSQAVILLMQHLPPLHQNRPKK